MTSAWVVSIPCGYPLYTLSVPFFRSLTDFSAASAIGTIEHEAGCLKDGLDAYVRRLERHGRCGTLAAQAARRIGSEVLRLQSAKT